MRKIETLIPDLLIIEPTVLGDDRGHFFESYNAKSMDALGIHSAFVQDNQSRSSKGILRGLHYQIGSACQQKLVRCLSGEIYDVALDLRQGSPTFRRSFGIKLTAENKKMLWVPSGFAHGFLTLSESADVLYKVSNYWLKEAERGVRWSSAGISWPELDVHPTLNSRDETFPKLVDILPADLFDFSP